MEIMPRQDHSQLLTTLRDVATSAATIFGALAGQQEATAAPRSPSAPPPPSRDEDADWVSAAVKDPEPPPDCCVLCGSSARCIVAAMKSRICEPCIHASAAELVYQQQRDAVTVWVNSIGQRLTDLLVLAQGAVEGDGQRTLPILDLALERLAHEYSQRLGLFSLEDRGVAPRADATIIALAGNAP